MTVSNSHLAYEDCYAIMDRALEKEKGVRYWTDSYGSAIHLAMRLNYARKIARDITTKAFEEGDPRYGKSAYDSLTIRRPKKPEDGKWWVIIEKITVDLTRVEEL